MTCCKSCVKYSKIAGKMATKRNNKGGKGVSISTIVMTGLGVAGGMAGASMLSKSTFVTENPMLKIALPIGGAIALPMLMGRGQIVTLLSTGMLAAGVTNAVIQFAPGLAKTVGLASISGGGSSWKTNYNPGIAGGGSNWKTNYNPGVAGPSVVL